MITLGLLAALALIVLAFAFSARTERFAARHDRDRVNARQYVDLALVQAMDKVNLFTSPLGSPAHFNIWYIEETDEGTAWNYERNLQPQDLFTRNAFVSLSGEDNVCDNFFDNACTNLIPAGLLDEARQLTPHWIPIEMKDEATDPSVGTNGYVAFAVINCSGLLDAHTVTSNQLAQLLSDNTDIENIDDFLRDRARDTAPESILTNYTSFLDLRLRNRGLRPSVSNLFTWSYDPGPDVTVINGDVYSNRDVQLVPKFNVNSWKNEWDERFDLVDLADQPDKLAEHYKGDTFGDWLAEVTNRFATIGFARPEALAWNLVNFMDPDRIPQGPEGHLSWQEPWPVEDVPLINEIAVARVPLDFTDGPFTNRYAWACELWYPFVTNAIVADDEAELVVAVYTNWPDAGITGADWIERVMQPAREEGFAVTNRIERMEQGTDTEFLTFTMPPPYIFFPVAVTNAVGDSGGGYRPDVPGSMQRLVPAGSDTSVPRYDLQGETLWLPLGPVQYHTYESMGDDSFQRVTRTVTNEIRLLARVRLGTHWVDEAMGYHPDDSTRDTLVPFHEPHGYEVNDPRRNGHPDDWRRYDATDLTSGPDGDRYVCTLSGATNTLCDPWHLPWGQGLPLVHFNRPLRHAGDLGYLQQPESYAGDNDRSRTVTNLWQSICLADPTPLAQHRFSDTSAFTYVAGSVLEFFTVRATNTPVRGLVHFSTTHTNVVRALLADLTVGIPGSQTNLFGSDIDWMQEVFFAAQQELYAPGNTPIVVGALCYGIGSVPLYRDATDPSDQSDPSDLSQARPWQGSLGNDLKEDILRGLAERISFRQHVFVICLAGKTTAPSGRTTAIQRAAAIVLRDAYTGRWKVVAWEWL